MMKLTLVTKTKCSIFIMAFILLILTACTSQVTPSDSSPTTLPSPPETIPPTSEFSETPRTPEQNSILYEGTSYTIFYNELIDTYLIACGLLFDFEGNYLFDSNMKIDYQQTIEHFLPYREHSFIQELEAFADVQNKNARVDVLYYLTQYVISMSNTGLGIGNIQSDSFLNDEEFNIFLNHLYQFYQDTGAMDFFESSNLHRNQEQYLSEHITDLPTDDLFHEMEDYVGNKTDIFGGSNIRYYSLISVYKSPNHASFQMVGMNNDTYLTSIQSPLGYDGDFNINQLFETAFHEALHMYVNPGVEAQKQLIEDLSKAYNPSDFTNGQYVDMPWYRIVDEAFVRVIHARIYGRAYDNFDVGYQQILTKEMEFGFQHLDVVYHSLNEYEENRSLYPKINDYFTILIEQYLNQ